MLRRCAVADACWRRSRVVVAWSLVSAWSKMVMHSRSSRIAVVKSCVVHVQVSGYADARGVVGGIGWFPPGSC
jgi:hypothetical protein